MSLDFQTLPALLRRNAEEHGSRPALLGGAGAALGHHDLWLRVSAAGHALNRLGVGRRDRVAIVLPQGPELALAFLAVASCATAAPLNPAYLEPEFRFYLGDIQARALIVPQGGASAARAAATALGIQVVELAPGSFPGGLGLPVEALPPGPEPGAASPGDVALVLHTSGTTSRPKMVPLTHANLCASARNVLGTLALQPSDRCLCVMPLFHIHGLVACVLASLAAGGGTVCAAKFEAAKLDGWLDEFQPTWCSAVPTMHQAILGHVQSSPVARHSLRFIRSSSAALPPSVMAGLESAFGVPVIESYGMTEAAHQMTSNPLPPLPRKPGSVGRPAGPEVAILDEAGRPLPRGQTGEIAIRGPNVTPGYANNPDANAAAFADGWFRTGDQGCFDADGYLFITGRLKELINRGGEKVAPREVDEALLSHPDVRQAVAFAVPHPSLGEDVAAAVVLQEGSKCSEADLRAFVAGLLPPFKVPTRIVVVADVPKGPTGKVQRIGLAGRLAPALAVAYEAPASPREEQVAAIMGETLGLGQVGRHGNFFFLGGDSLRATKALARLQNALAMELPATLLFQCPTPALLAARIDEIVAQGEMDLLADELSKLSPEERAALLDGPGP